MPTEIKPITEAPACLIPLAVKTNEVGAALRPLLNLRGAGGVQVTKSASSITIGCKARRSSGTAPGSMIYNDGSQWGTIAPPTVSNPKPVLRHNGTRPYWDTPETCNAA